MDRIGQDCIGVCIEWSSLGRDVCCWICTDRHSTCWGEARFMDSTGKGREGSIRARTAVCIEGCQRAPDTFSRGRETESARGRLLCTPNHHSHPSRITTSSHQHVKPVGRFGRNRPGRRAKGPPPIDRRRLTNGPHLRQEVATVIGVYLGAFPPCGSSVDDGETAFTTDILQTSQQVGPLQAPRLPRRGWRGDAQEEAETSMAMVARRAFWKRQIADTQNS